MKKCLIVLIFAVVAVVSAAAACPNLECVAFFGDKYRGDPTTKVVVVNSTGNYFRSIKVHDNEKLVKQIKKAVANDRRHAVNSTESYTSEKTSVILNLPDNISIGFTQKDPGSCTLFVQGAPDAFK